MDKIGICSDHAGFEIKEYIKKLLQDEYNIEVIDFGTNSNQSCDYPDFAHKLGNAIEMELLTRGISVCGSGNGISMVLNKYSKVRAALCWFDEIVKLARAHNDANIMSIPARFVSKYECREMLDSFLNTKFEGGRHQERINKIPII